MSEEVEALLRDAERIYGDALKELEAGTLRKAAVSMKGYLRYLALI